MQKQSESFHSERNLGIDLLRSASILYIVFHWHLLEYLYGNPHYNAFTIRLTNVILGVFVFISGYFIGTKKIQLDKISLIKFYQVRFFRIYPLYIAALISCLICKYVDYITLLKSIFLISMFDKPAALTLWFITMIMVYYLITPLLMYLILKRKTILLLLSSGASVLILLTLYYFKNCIDIRLVVFFPAYLFGLIFAQKNIQSILENKYLCVLFLILSVLISLIGANHYGAFLLLSTPMITICAYILFKIFNNTTPYLYRFRKIILFISYSSYCIYLFHRPLFITLTNLFFPENCYSRLIYLLVFCAPLIIIISFYIQKYYDLLFSSLSLRVNSKL